MTTFPYSTRLTGLPETRFGTPMVTSFLRLFLPSFQFGAERPTEAKAGNGSGLGHEEKMKLLAAYEMLTAKLESHDLPLTHPEIELYESALKVIGPLD